MSTVEPLELELRICDRGDGTHGWSMFYTAGKFVVGGELPTVVNELARTLQNNQFLPLGSTRIDVDFSKATFSTDEAMDLLNQLSDLHNVRDGIVFDFRELREEFARVTGRLASVCAGLKKELHLEMAPKDTIDLDGTLKKLEAAKGRLAHKKERIFKKGKIPTSDFNILVDNLDKWDRERFENYNRLRSFAQITHSPQVVRMLRRPIRRPGRGAAKKAVALPLDVATTSRPSPLSRFI